MQNQNRRLAAILFTDIVGYTAMMQKDEQEAVVATQRYISVLKQFVTSHDGEILNDYGDGSLCTFQSATQAIRCAMELQRQLQMEPKVPLRVGLHVGEIFFEGGKVFGDGVNVASRIQSLSIAGSVLFSTEINSKIKNQQEFKSVPVGRFHFKNVDEPMEVFAIANDGFIVPRKKQIEGKLQNTSQRGKLIIVASLVLGILSFIMYRYYSRQNHFAGSEQSIAILPFKIFGSNKDNLGEGLVEDILIRLSKIKEIKVISNRSSNRYVNSNKSLKEIGEELSVTSIVMGSVQQIENRLRVTAQLIDCKTEKTIWADDFNKDIVQVFDIQTEVAIQIVNALKTKLTTEEKKELSKRYTDNVDAYKFYRKGRGFWDKRSPEGYDSAEANYKKAIELDPDYALAYVGLADCYTYNLKGLSQLVAMPIASDYVNKALLIDSTLGEAITTSAFIKAVFDYDFEYASRTLEKVTTSYPNYSLAHIYYGNYFVQVPRNYEKGINEIKKALRLDPLSIQVNYVLGRNYYFANRLDSAESQLRKTLVLNPKYDLAKSTLAHVLLAKKNYSEAMKLIQELPTSGPSSFQEYQGSLLSYAYALSGDIVKANQELRKTLTENPNQLPYNLAGVYIVLKDYQNALSRIEQAYEMREVSVVFLKVDPVLEPIRNEPRVKAIMKKMQLE
ncbi:MAG: tetratricopeptide repeat protein [Ginsengibacter sp.]